MISESPFKVYNASAGSGKTFTLVKEYLKILLVAKNEFEFQKILAITFTNKAAAEMKQRVLKTLKDASQNVENNIVSDLLKETGLVPEIVQKKSQRILKNILYNYASFHINTIDSFTHKLIRTFSLDLGLPLDFEVEMDTDPLLEETIDLLISKIGQDKDLTEILVKYTLDLVEDDKSWNITDSLVSVARLLLNEENEVEVSKLINTNLSDFTALEKKLRTYLSDTEKAFKEIGQQAIDLIDENDITHSSFTSSAVPNYFKKFISGWNDKEEEIAIKTVEKCFDTGSFYAKAKPKDPKKLEDRDKIDAIQNDLYPFYELSKQLMATHFGQYFLVKKILKSLVPLAVLSHINKEYTHLKEENNICVNAEFNRVISKQIKNEPVPFIYERLGEKFQYFFIDEMQDTSELQWENLIPLIANALSQGNGQLMLVGDAKQSIYRWRGGKASQFVALSDEDNHDLFHVDKKVVTLGTNYRSYSNVINFNNDFFAFLSSYIKEPAYQDIYAQEKHQQTNSKQGGYVRLEVFEREEEFVAHEVYPEKIHQMILEIKSKGFYYGDICVLTRKKNDGIVVADYLVSKGIEVISPDSLLLKNNKVVQVFVFLLRWLENPEDKEVLIQVLYYLYDHLNIKIPEHEFYEDCLSKTNPKDLFAYLGVDFSLTAFFSLSLYDGLEYLIRTFSFQNISDVFVQAFLDVILQYQLKESGSLQMFLAYWDKKKKNLKVEVAPSENAVQIMTIHKSKGLEFPVVIFPFDLNTEDINREKIWYQTNESDLFNGFESFQIKASSKLALYGKQGEDHLSKLNAEIQLDNFNLLYVALTRAEEQLYILSDTKKKSADTPKQFSDYFKEYMFQKNIETIYEIGNNKRLSSTKKSEHDYLLEEFFSVDKKNNQIFIVQNEGDEDEARLYGNLIHKAFEKIISIKDLDLANNYIDQQGLPLEVSKKAKQLLQNVIRHPELTNYYQEGLEVYTERSFLTQSGEINIMDRVVFYNHEAVIIDYKTGAFSKSHELQINNYANILRGLGYFVKAKLLVYCNDLVDVFSL
ncbi:UvrD-helicase domain-containing protein [Wenyingzhuangia sp. chi5]|uniref:DNA 3'-5' helicase n=1 Tax=Wenyingzhuangia gilva TaxID=3057677 RepID=A0ABT8VQC7_9FLAO|nr:UvrD-helicase domain-containing protein [Wenyingzhuangia sp. chi5]MDO3694165.1 UvrD-helicase domain-containing protein [Wenyingzhuangia sp. chi5]